MSDNARNPAGLDTLADRFQELSDDTAKMYDYWSTHATPLASQTGKGIPGQVLPSISEMTPGVQKQSTDLGDHITCVETAMRDSADLYRNVESRNVDEVNDIWGVDNVPQSDDKEGRTSGGLHDVDLPSTEKLSAAPEPIGPGLWEVSVKITTLVRDIETEAIVFSWIDQLIGGIFGQKPTEWVTEWMSGDWEAIGKVGKIFENFRDYTNLMQGLIIHTGKGIRVEGEWTGTSSDMAQESINGNANKLEGLIDIFRDAKLEWENWQNVAYVQMQYISGLLGSVPGTLLRAKKLCNQIFDLHATIANTVKGAFQGENYLKNLLEELLGIALSILQLFKKIIAIFFYILQAFVLVGSYIPALVEGDTDLDKSW
ncbi:hypothetical protein [Parenemella sanctibonifatiensis]|uniref:Uncharacterized protein n=1 Tax=Parenemella sanctibonifatiensis TaxID=2016505 RepID=A0A255EAD5_9ACTN|nr:hypothetical protein [Parenemella sanctibonifatiensis]OYN86362.1 hypothetical protein CGZ92_08355 [Parenemella sanctibonifatiensis]